MSTSGKTIEERIRELELWREVRLPLDGLIVRDLYKHMFAIKAEINTLQFRLVDAVGPISVQSDLDRIKVDVARILDLLSKHDAVEEPGGRPHE
ncbi:hypothetical protein [Nocardia anaemiae]|uniref:hypothetical protein n=1 Tax=Nocardia anaemiae TaxID=263910 RepID=UPI0007A3AB5B|nr:hypothetical protein [Nocardia anaemiae]